MNAVIDKIDRKIYEHCLRELREPLIIILSENDFRELTRELRYNYGAIQIESKAKKAFRGIEIISSKDINEIRIF